MFELYNLSANEIIGFSMVLMRMSAFVVSMAIVGSEQVPAHAKILLALVLSLVIYPTLKMTPGQLDGFNGQIIWVALKEVMVGLILGFISRLFFFAMTVTGELVSLSVGLSSEQLLNPTVGGRTSPLQQFHVLLGSLFFLTFNGHYYLIGGIIESFQAVPISVEGFHTLSRQFLAEMTGSILWAGVRMASPIVVAIFCMNLVMGVMGRAVPQINVLATSLPVNIMVGFVIIFMGFPFLVMSIDDVIRQSVGELFRAMKTM